MSAAGVASVADALAFSALSGEVQALARRVLQAEIEEEIREDTDDEAETAREEGREAKREEVAADWKRAREVLTNRLDEINDAARALRAEIEGFEP